jgi:hypothetical protein
MTPAWFGRVGLLLILSAVIFGAGAAGPFASVPLALGMTLVVCSAHEALVLLAARRQWLIR